MQGEISASDLAEFDFCSVAWYLDREGYRKSKITSMAMTKGITMHRRVSAIHRRASRSMSAGIVGIAIVLALLVATFLGYL